jgi:hypothetical protein
MARFTDWRATLAGKSAPGDSQSHPNRGDHAAFGARSLAGVRRLYAGRGDTNMVLKAPGIITFVLSIVLMVCVLVVKFFGAQIPLMLGNEFWFLLLAHIILVLGCIMRGL